MSHQAFGAAERLRKTEKPYCLNKAAGLRTASLQLEAEHSAKAGLLASRNSMARMCGQPRIMARSNKGMLEKKLSDRLRAPLLPLHARKQRADKQYANE